MSSAWLLPEHIADVLPSGARHIEALRRGLLDGAERYGFELVIPPLLEHIESLLSGTGHELDLKTFKLVDQSSGRTLGLRADSTPQVARIDAHLLNREGVVRLCYCGPVLHTRASGINASREPLQFGAEIYGYAGLEADLEIQDLALESLRTARLGSVALDLADARIVRGIVAGVPVDVKALDAVYAALAAKDVPLLRELTATFPADARRALLTLVGLYGGVDVVDAARRELPDRPLIGAALDDLRRLAEHAAATHPEVAVGFDLADLSGYAYYSGPRFAVYAAGASDAVARGGRYDEVGAVFGRNRPAVGFSLDVKQLAALSSPPPSPDVVRAPWSDDRALRNTVRDLRAGGAVIVTDFENGAVNERGAWRRELVADAGRWSLREC